MRRFIGTCDASRRTTLQHGYTDRSISRGSYRLPDRRASLIPGRDKNYKTNTSPASVSHNYKTVWKFHVAVEIYYRARENGLRADKNGGTLLTH